MNDLDRRLRKLERVNQLYRILSLILGLVLIGILGLGMLADDQTGDKRVPEVLQAGRFEVVNDKGEVVLVADSDAKGNGSLAVLHHTRKVLAKLHSKYGKSAWLDLHHPTADSDGPGGHVVSLHTYSFGGTLKFLDPKKSFLDPDQGGLELWGGSSGSVVCRYHDPIENRDYIVEMIASHLKEPVNSEPVQHRNSAKVQMYLTEKVSGNYRKVNYPKPRVMKLEKVVTLRKR